MMEERIIQDMKIHHIGYLAKDLYAAKSEFLNLDFQVKQKMAGGGEA